MNERRYYHFICLLLMIIISNASCEHIPTTPVVEYDSDNAKII